MFPTKHVKKARPTSRKLAVSRIGGFSEQFSERAGRVRAQGNTRV